MNRNGKRSCLLLAILALAGCGTPPKEYFYTLNGATPQEKPAAAQARYDLAVGPVSVPEMVNRPQFVIRRGDNRIDLVEQHRWAQPLPTEIARALAADLASRLAQARVFYYKDYGARHPDCRVLLDIDRFDAMLGEGVAVQGAWTVRCAEPAAARRGYSTVREAAQGGGFDALAAAYGRALSAMSVEIANAVTAIRAPGAGQ